MPLHRNESVLEEGITYDRSGRMEYHPDFHPNHQIPLTDEELEYLCKFYEVDPTRTIAFALGRTEHALRSKVNSLRRSGLYDYYKRRWEIRFTRETQRG